MLKKLAPACPFDYVSDKDRGNTWSGGITAEERESFVWLKPSLKAEMRFLEWTKSVVLRQAALSRFAQDLNEPNG